MFSCFFFPLHFFSCFLLTHIYLSYISLFTLYLYAEYRILSLSSVRVEEVVCVLFYFNVNVCDSSPVWKPVEQTSFNKSITS